METRSRARKEAVVLSKVDQNHMIPQPFTSSAMPCDDTPEQAAWCCGSEFFLLTTISVSTHFLVECVPLRRGPTFLSVAITGLRACYSSKNRVLSLYTKQQPGSPAERKKQCRSVGHDPYWMIILLDDKESCHRVSDNFSNRASRGTHSRRSTADPCISSPSLTNPKISLLPLPLAST